MRPGGLGCPADGRTVLDRPRWTAPVGCAEGCRGMELLGQWLAGSASLGCQVFGRLWGSVAVQSGRKSPFFRKNADGLKAHGETAVVPPWLCQVPGPPVGARPQASLGAWARTCSRLWARTWPWQRTHSGHHLSITTLRHHPQVAIAAGLWAGEPAPCMLGAAPCVSAGRAPHVMGAFDS